MALYLTPYVGGLFSHSLTPTVARVKLLMSQRTDITIPKSWQGCKLFLIFFEEESVWQFWAGGGPGVAICQAENVTFSNFFLVDTQPSHSQPSSTRDRLNFSLGVNPSNGRAAQVRHLPLFSSSSKASLPHWLQGWKVVCVVIVTIYHKNDTLSRIFFQLLIQPLKVFYVYSSPH